MFGYITPIKSKLREQDFILYRAFYCGICKAIGENFGQLPRFSVSYDAAFLAALVSDCLSYPQKIEEQSCIGNPFKKKPMVVVNELMVRLGAVNIILAYHKLRDDVIDGDLKKRTAIKIFKKAYNKAKALVPEADEIVRRNYDALRECEKRNEDSIDRVSHSFATLLKELFAYILKEKADDEVLSLAYNVGKFVYIADALDDVDEDYKSGNYNPFLAAYGNYESRTQFIESNRADIEFVFASTVNRVIAAFNDRRYTQSYSLLENIIYYGLREKTEELLNSVKKLPRPRV